MTRHGAKKEETTTHHAPWLDQSENLSDGHHVDRKRFRAGQLLVTICDSLRVCCGNVCCRARVNTQSSDIPRGCPENRLTPLNAFPHFLYKTRTTPQFGHFAIDT